MVKHGSNTHRQNVHVNVTNWSMSPSATPGTKMERQCHQVPGCHQVPRLPRKVAWRPGRLTAPKRARRVCHACHTKNQGGCRQVPRLPRPRTWKVNVAKCHACHTNGTSMSPSATPATQWPPKGATRASPAPQVPRVPHKTKVDVARCHACYSKRRWMSPSATPATQSCAAPRATNRAPARHQSQPSAASATHATQNQGGCRQVPCRPRKTQVDVTKRHACHAKWCGAPGD